MQMQRKSEATLYNVLSHTFLVTFYKIIIYPLCHKQVSYLYIVFLFLVKHLSILKDTSQPYLNLVNL